MRLHARMLSGDVISVEMDVKGESFIDDIKEAIHAIRPEWPTYVIRVFTTETESGEIDPHQLRDNDWLGLVIIDPIFVRVITGADHSLFSICVSERPDFSYPHTRTLFFEFDNGCFYHFRHRRNHNDLSSMIRQAGEFPEEQLDYIIRETETQWNTIMETYPEMRKRYLERLEIVHSIER